MAHQLLLWAPAQTDLVFPLASSDPGCPLQSRPPVSLSASRAQPANPTSASRTSGRRKSAGCTLAGRKSVSREAVITLAPASLLFCLVSAPAQASLPSAIHRASTGSSSQPQQL